MHCVVGSGPSGVACAQALLERGLEVLMIDAGLKLEEDRAQAVQKLAASAPAGWDAALVAKLKENSTASSQGLPQKLVYGSDFPYRESERFVPCAYEGVGLRPSLAQGGLSNVWGAAMMPSLDSDLIGWPFQVSQLAEHYAAVLKMTGIAARADDLAAKFPLYTDEPGKIELSRQAGAMLDRMTKSRPVLNGLGIEFGAARIAIQTRRSPDGPGCVYCGLCMFGCPYGYIYNSASTLRKLQKHPRFSYQPDTVATSLAENGNEVTLRTRHRVSGVDSVIKASRIYLAAGAIPTTKLLLESREEFDRTITMKDSQYFLVPLALTRAVPDVRHEPLHALSQLFVEIFDPQISARTVHLQIYSYSELMAEAVRHTLSRFRLDFDFVIKQIENRLVVAQGFLHSDDSSQIAVTLRKSPTPKLELKAQLNPLARHTVRKVISKLGRSARLLGAFAVSPMVQVAEP